MKLFSSLSLAMLVRKVNCSFTTLSVILLLLAQSVGALSTAHSPPAVVFAPHTCSESSFGASESSASFRGRVDADISSEPRWLSTSGMNDSSNKCLGTMSLRGGADKKSPTSKAALGEGALERLLGKQYSLDMKESGSTQVLIKLIKRHRQGGGEFNAITLNGKEYQIPGTKGASGGEDADSHFKELKGQSTKNQPKSSEALGELKKVVGVQTDYKGLEYTEAELAKLPKAEAEYRRELMARSKQEMKMEMGFEGVMKGGLDMMKTFREAGPEQDVMQRFKKEEGAEADFTTKLPTKGILQFRFKEKELKASAKAASKPAQPAAWAKGRAQALKRKNEAQEKKKPEAISDRVNRWFSVRFLVQTAVTVAMKVVMVAVNVLLSIKNALTASRASAADVRKARSSAIGE